MAIVREIRGEPEPLLVTIQVCRFPDAGKAFN